MNSNEVDSILSANSQNGNDILNDGKKKKLPTAIVQIPDYEPVDVKLSKKCSTIAEHASFLQQKINQSQGKLLGLRLIGPISLCAIFEDNVAVLDHDDEDRLDPDCKYSFHFELITGDELGKAAGDEQLNAIDNLRAEMAKKDELIERMKEEMADLVQGRAEHEDQLMQLEMKKNTLKWQVEEQQEKLTEQEEKLEQYMGLEMEKDTLKKRVEELERNVEQRLAPIIEFANQIHVPNVTNLSKKQLYGLPWTIMDQNDYEKEKLLKLIGLGETITSSLSIKQNLLLRDSDLLQSIVDMLATALEPAEIIGQFLIEWGDDGWGRAPYGFTWPKRVELIEKPKEPGAALKFGHDLCLLAEYELVNQGHRFQVDLHYKEGLNFDKLVAKFRYRRMD